MNKQIIFSNNERKPDGSSPPGLSSQLGLKVVAISGPDGACHIPEGMTSEMNDYMLVMRASNRDKVQDLADDLSQ